MPSRLAALLVGAIVVESCSAMASPSGTTPSPIRSQTPTASATVPSPSAPASLTAAVATTGASPVAVTDGCPPGQEGLVASSLALERSLRIGSTRFALVTAGIQNRSGDAQADDAIAAWATLTNETPTVSAAAGSTGRLAGSSALRLLSGTLAVFPASAFDLAAGRVPDSGSVPTTALRAADGTLAFRFPPTAGRWVLAFGVNWQSLCIKGDGVAYAFASTR